MELGMFNLMSIRLFSTKMFDRQMSTCKDLWKILFLTMHCFPRSACSRTLHFLHILLVFRLHTLQRLCGPVHRIWFTPSKRMSGNCDMKPDAALGVAVRSDCSKLRTACRRSSRLLWGLSSTKQ
ncbi:hypothetical protein T05_5054 [Trichinella murrelli]|uniref:Uncharacterized protein n=1 Tax=Trichinella murrelli TaxID=144512 RepID=A0A0V0TIK5_9BILA|nr:hypothetical protein T05_5054 [Trichinella murrelli]